VARKNPLGKIKDAAVGTIKDPIGTGQKAVGQAVGQALGTIGTVTATVGAVTSKVPGRKKAAARSEPRPKPVAVPDAPSRPHGDPVTPISTDRTRREDSAPSVATVAKKAPATKAPAARKSAKKVAKKAPAKAATSVPTPSDVAKKTAAKKTAAKTTAKAAAPAKAAAKKTPAKKAPAQKAAVKKAPAKKAAKKAAKKTTALTGSDRRPLSAAELAAGAGTEVITPVGTRGADVGTNPATNISNLQQVGTAPLMDPGTIKAVASESDILRRAADPNKG
jgi:hypothetical protein